jgi:hypothetical protein
MAVLDALVPYLKGLGAKLNITYPMEYKIERKPD